MTAISSTNQNIISPSSLLDQLNWRYATKKFDPARKIPSEIWTALEETLVLTPSSFGLQPWKFVVVTDALLRMKLRQASWNQPQIIDASHLVVFAYKKDLKGDDVNRFVQRIADVRGVSLESMESYKQIMLTFVNRVDHGFDINVWSAHQLYISLGNFLTAAAMLGIDACPMEGIDPKKYDEILGLDKQGYHVMFVATAGYRAKDDDYGQLAKVRYEKADVLDHR